MSTDSEYEGKSQVDTELQDFLEMEKHKAQLNAQVKKKRLYSFFFFYFFEFLKFI